MDNGRRDPYEVLGTTRDATDEEIRSAYRRMARKHHPDKGGSEKEFLKIQEAYNLLSDPQTRAAYDQGGWGGVDMQQQAGGEMPEFFHQFFNGSPFQFFNMSGQSPTPSSGKKRVPDRIIRIDVPIEEAYQGKQTRYVLKRKRCRGDHCKPALCKQCGGAGRVPVRPQNMPHFMMIPSTMAVCPTCAGLGVSISEKDMEAITETIGITIPRMCPDGFQIVIPGKTDEIPGMESGNLILEIHIRRNDPNFRLENGHVISTLPISYEEAVGGFFRDVVFLDGRTYRLHLRPYTSIFTNGSSGDTVRVVVSKGFYRDQEMLYRGDWIVHFPIKYPTGDTRHIWSWKPSIIPEKDGVVVMDISSLPVLEKHATHEPRTTTHHQECRQS